MHRALRVTLSVILLFILAVALSSIFKREFGAPNYGLGVVVAVTLACYLYGAVAASVVLVAALVGVYVVAIEPTVASAFPRLIVIVITSVVTCSLVMLLRKARQNLARLNDDLRDVQTQLAAALEYERNIATTMQKAFLPALPDRMAGVSVAAVYEAGSDEAQIGGDFYDLLELGDGRFAISLGDVSGKGIQAARQAVSVRYGLRSYALGSDSPADTLRRLNLKLCGDPEFAGFTTLFHGIFDPAHMRLTYCNAGHEPALLLRSTGECVHLGSTGMLMGVMCEADIEQAEVSLGQGDILLVYSDGFSEARGSRGFLGVAGIENLLRCANAGDPKTVLDTLLEEVRDFADGEFRDDVAAVLLRIE